MKGWKLTDMRVAPMGRYEWERLVRRIVMPWSHKALALLLATWADADGSRVRPGLDLLACAVGGDERPKRTVRRILGSLVGEWGLLEQTARGGGRGGAGRVTEYRLTIPVDLLDRHDLLDPSGRADSVATQVASQSDPHPVDNLESVATQVAHENDFQGPNGATSGRLSGQNPRLSGQKSRLSGHPARPTTKTNHKTNHQLHQHGSCVTDVTTDTRASPTATLDDLLPLSRPDTSAPPDAKCEHGLSAGVRDDGSPRCPHCRRGLPATRKDRS